LHTPTSYVAVYEERGLLSGAVSDQHIEQQIRNGSYMQWSCSKQQAAHNVVAGAATSADAQHSQQQAEYGTVTPACRHTQMLVMRAVLRRCATPV
jgi:hypothetical protein